MGIFDFNKKKKKIEIIKEYFDKNLNKLLKANNVLKSSAMIEYKTAEDFKNGIGITFYEGNGFKIEIPPWIENTIVIKEQTG